MIFPLLKEKICESPRSDPNINTASDEGEGDQVLEALNMTERIASQLEMICQTLASVENRLQRLEGIFERFSVLEKSINSLQTGLSTLSEKSRIIAEKTNYIEKAMEFENAEIEELKKKDKENEDKIKELEDKLLYQEVYNRREINGSLESPNLLPVPRIRLKCCVKKKSWIWKMQRILNFRELIELARRRWERPGQLSFVS